MRTKAIQNKGTLFLLQLTEELRKKLGDTQVQRDRWDNDVDLLVTDPHSGKRIAIRFENAGDYGELEIATILPIERRVRNHPDQQLILVSFSDIPELLSTALQELKVPTLTQPTVEKVVDQVQLALSA